MGMVFWTPFSASELPARSDPEPGDGRYLGDMSLFRPESVRLVEQALNDGPEAGMTGRQVWQATDRAVSELTVRLILGEMERTGLVERESTPRPGRRRAIRVFRAL